MVGLVAEQRRLLELAAGRVGGALVEPVVAIAKILKVVYPLRVEEHSERQRVDSCVAPLQDILQSGIFEGRGLRGERCDGELTRSW